MTRPIHTGQINAKPFWKEPTLKHVWNRLNDGAKIMLYAVLYIIVCFLFARFVSPYGALWMLAFGVGFSFGWIVCDLMQPIENTKDEYEYQRIEFPGEDQ
jgi:hypothetical protein